jgi:hypothetical protein
LRSVARLDDQFQFAGRKILALFATKLSMVLRVATHLTLAAGIIFLSSFYASKSVAQTNALVCRSAQVASFQAFQKLQLFKEIIAEKIPQIREQGYDVDAEGFLIDARNSAKVRVSKLDVIQPPHLYEWASGEHHEAWVHNGRISAAEMRGILKEPPQFTGRGFYVSTNPFDSSNFGTHMTVFQPQGAMLVLESTNFLKRGSTEEVTRLQKAGIDAVRNPRTPTWLAVISSAHLKIDPRPFQDPQFDLIETLKLKTALTFQAVEKFEQQGIMDRVPVQSLLGRLWRNQATQADQEAIYDLLVMQGLEVPENDKNKSHPLSAKLMAAAAAHQERQTGLVRSADELLPLLRFALKTSEYWRGDARKLQTETQYGQILNYFDIKTLALLNRGIEVKEIPDLRYVKKATASLISRRQKIDVSRIHKIEDFLAAASQLLGRKISFRDHDVIMSSEEEIANSHLLTLEPATAQMMGANKLLNLYDQQTSRRDGQVQTGIAYTSIETMQELVSTNQITLPPELAQRLMAVKPSSSGSYRSAESKAVYTEVLECVLTKLVEDYLSPMAIRMISLVGSPSGSTAYDLYRAFMSLHPFSDGNGRSGRIFYELMALRYERTSTQLELPIFDLDLLGVEPPVELLKAGSFLRSWVSRARSDVEFLQRSDVALETLIRFYPRLKTLFPELGGAHASVQKASRPLVVVGSTCRYCSSSASSGIAVAVGAVKLANPGQWKCDTKLDQTLRDSKIQRTATERLERGSFESKGL